MSANPPATDRLCAVITTIQASTECMVGLSRKFQEFNGSLYIVGDRKGPESCSLPGAEFLRFDQQASLPLRLAKLLPADHYARKNLGYLMAIKNGSGCIYETDDDNTPLASWAPRPLLAQVRQLKPTAKWLNVYRLFSEAPVWPRGFPLEEVRAAHTPRMENDSAPVEAPIQQGLAAGEPDVDAVWRLLYGGQIGLEDGPSVLLPAGCWCPFNSQSTWWWPKAFPLLYLPTHCPFRATDIWRSLIAQRCLWEFSDGLVFHGAEVFQDRNTHDLLDDFRDEVRGYLLNSKIAAWLETLELEPGAAAVGRNLERCYRLLIEKEVFPAAELPLVQAWLEDLQGLT